MRNIEALSALGLQWLNVAEPADAAVAAEIPNKPIAGKTSVTDVLINILLLQEEEQNHRRSTHQCTEWGFQKGILFLSIFYFILFISYLFKFLFFRHTLSLWGVAESVIASTRFYIRNVILFRLAYNVSA